MAFAVAVGLLVLASGEVAAEPWDLSLQKVEERALVPSSDGHVVELRASVHYEVEAAAVSELERAIGSPSELRPSLVTPYFRNAVRDVVMDAPARTLATEGGRKGVAQRIEAALEEALDRHGIRVEEVRLLDVELPAKVREAIGSEPR